MEIENVAANFDYNMEFLEDIQAQASLAVAKATKKQYSYNSLDIGVVYDYSDTIKLSHYIEVIENIKRCNPCFSGNEIEDVIHTVKNLITKVQ